MKKTYTNIIWILSSLVFFTGCGDDTQKPGRDIPTMGKITIAVDEAYRPIMASHIDIFNADYKDAHIGVIYRPEEEAVRAMMMDSVRLYIAPRDLTSKEKEYLKQRNHIVRTTPIAKDGVALITNPSQGEVKLTMQQLQAILAGTVKTWDEVGVSGGNIQIVFDNPNSSAVHYIRTTLCPNNVLPPNTFATKNNNEVIDHVSKNAGALGIIGVSWISDKDNAQVRGFLSKVNVVALSKAAGEEYFQPYQAYLATKEYPLTRELFMVSREDHVGLGRGFVNFVASDRGQRIFLKSGLVPATIPTRVIKTKSEPL